MGEGGCPTFLVGSGWLPGAFWLVAANVRWALDGCFCFLMASAWLLLFPSGLRVVVMISWCALLGCCYTCNQRGRVHLFMEHRPWA